MFFRLALLERGEKAAAVSQVLQEVTQPANLSTMFDEFVDEVSAGNSENPESYTHDNGFDKIVLFEDETTKMKMRLHIWDPVTTGSRMRQNVHNHRWDFASMILLGQSDQITYRFAEDSEEGEEFFHYRYYARGIKEHYDLEELGISKLVEIRREHFEAGELYCVVNEALHRVDVDDDIAAATLVITHENVGWVTNDLLSERNLGSEKVRLQSPSMTTEDVISRVLTVRNLLKV
jgi:hypothetical protein